MTASPAKVSAMLRRSDGPPSRREPGYAAQSVAGAGHGLDDRGVAQLATQRHHRYPDRVRERICVLVPCLLQQLLGADHGALGAHEHLEDGELLG